MALTIFRCAQPRNASENVQYFKFNKRYCFKNKIPKSARTSNVYNMSGRVVSDTQTRAEGESLYIRYNTDANVVNNLKNDSSYKFIGEVILKINVV